MKLTSQQRIGNAQDWLSLSDPTLGPGERVDREGLREQLSSTDADAEDVEEIASLIESFNAEARITPLSHYKGEQ